ncbi:MAG: peptidase M15 [Bacteroidetes bacterium]|nr:MAG: peptidase M15 [Bacteroidota bacterium]
MISKLSIIFLILLICGCASETEQRAKNTISKIPIKEELEPIKLPCALNESICNAGLVNIQHLNPNIRINLRYSGINNFLNQDLYGCLDSAYFQQETALMLDSAQKKLTAVDSNLHLLIWDAVRPRNIQWRMWNALDMPLKQKAKYVSNPRNGSIHNYGCAVDLTICYTNRKLMDMGTDFDHFGRASNIKSEYLLVEEGILTPQQLENRTILRSIMKSVGFKTISSEWWHFNALTRSVARSKYAIVE